MAIAVGAALWSADVAPLLTTCALVVLLVRSVRGLSQSRRPAKAMEVGFSELGFGLGYVLVTVLGFRLGL